jgi:hypothetical protein
VSFELAPAAVMRSAAWPIESLAPFGGQEPSRSLGAGRAFEVAYDAEIERERSALWDRTAGDASFLKALAVASDSLFTRVVQHAGRGAPRDKRTRHLETSLYRYLARASTCTTPQGLWAGVCLARFGEEDVTVHVPARVEFAPDLTPFAAALAELARRPDYRTVARHRLTPTVRARGDGSWRFLARTRRGEVGVHELRSDGSLGSLLECLAGAGTGTLDELAARARAPRAVLERFAEAGLLVGGIEFPTRFASPWEALEVAEGLLLGDDRAAWRRAVSDLSDLASRLSATFEAMSASAVAAELGHARARVTALLVALGVGGAPASAALRCDFRSPLSVTLGVETRRELLRGLSEHEHELLRPTRERRLSLASHVAGRPLALGDELPLHLPPPSPADEAADGARDNPWGCLVARLGEGYVRVVGIDESPVRPFARHGALLASGNEVERWVTGLFAKLEREHGVVPCDLVLPFDANPNVLARGNLARHAYEPWGACGLDLRDARLASESGALVLEIPSVGRAVVFAACTAVSVPCDPMAGPLAVMGFAEGMDDVAAKAPANGAFVRTESTSLSEDELKSLTRLPRRERYARWLELAAEFDWPDRVAVAIDGRRPLVVPTSSPLAIEAAFEGSREARAIVVERADTSARIRGATGRHVADVTVPFSRHPHAFTSLKPSRRSSSAFQEVPR